MLRIVRLLIFHSTRRAAGVKTARAWGLWRTTCCFFANVEVVCPVCHGQRFNETVLNVKYNGRSIKEVLDLTVEEAVEFFAGQTKLIRMLEVLRKRA